MFEKFKKMFQNEKSIVIDVAIIDCYNRSKKFTPESKEYTQIVENILTLNEAKSKTELDSKTKKIILMYLTGILMILLYENCKVITTKAFSIITKLTNT